ncbi:carboxymuconolactone decarboxylase family protein [Erythrobacter sp. JK5]|uniref:carboxymuconolactone decarboxylase family protein n=1 Tax=Erythrobacter sp. JK5 TaxID=2829500 RepID=UPI001BA64E60|nr:carboxymuconolactone decarboxylase family protein [Erythrobacter sp. JK5]QUL36956.1 carboxymuconolactone decarboxylase family protein [Erythrobacter sp. JK5]
MTRIAPKDPAEALGGKEAAEFARRMMGYIPNSVLTMAHWPELLDAFRGLVSVIYGQSRLDNGFKRLIGHAASLAAGCRYCQAHTGHGAIEQGIDPAKLEALYDFENSELISDAERAALSLAFAAGAQPNAATDAHFERLRAHFDEREQVEIMAVIAMFGFLNRWNDTLATSLEAEPGDFAESILSSRGWDRGAH